MGNIVEFILRLKDMMSGGMQRAASTARTAMATAERSVNRVSAAFDRTSRSGTRSIATLERAMRRLEYRRSISLNLRDVRTATQQINALQARIDRMTGSRGVSSGFGLKSLLLGGGLMAGLGMAGNAGLEAQAQKASFEVMAGQDKGGKLYSDLTKFAQDSIFGNEVYQNAQTMKAFGVETEKVMPNIKMLGDVSMGNKERLNSLSLAYSQITATGRLMGQDLLQLVNAGFNPLQIISQKTGKSMSDLKKIMEDGGISAKMVEMAFKSATSEGGQFYNMTNKIAQTDYGKVQAFKGQLEGFAMKVGGMIAPTIGNFVTNFLEPLLNWFSRAASWVQANSEWLTPLVLTVGAFALTIQLVTMATTAWTAAQAFLNVVLTANPVGLIIAGIVALIALIGYLIYKVDGWGEAWKNVVNGAKLLWQSFVATGKLAWDTFMSGIMIGLNKVKEGWYSFKNMVGLGSESENNAFIKKVQEDTERRKQQIANDVKQVNSLATQSANAFQKAGSSLTWNKNKTLKGFANEMKSNLGMGGAPTKGDFMKELSAGGGNKDKKGLSSKGVTHSGPQTITININKEMIGNVEIKTVNMKEGTNELEYMLEEMMLRVLNSMKTAN